MNDHILFRSDSLTEAASELKRIVDALEDVAGDLARVDTSEEWWSKLNIYTSRGRYDGLGAVRMLKSSTQTARENVADINEGIRKTQALFTETDRAITSRAVAALTGKQFDKYGEPGSGAADQPDWKSIISGIPIRMDQLRPLGPGSLKPQSTWDKFVELYKDKFSWSKFLSGAGYIGTIYDFIQDFRSGKSLSDYFDTGKDVYKFVKEAAQTYKNYMKIGNAVGKTKATQWWLKNITGLKSVGRVSTAQKVSTRFINNLKNKTSPFNLKKAFGDFTGANGTAKAVTSWAGVAFDGVLNFFSNKAEQAESGGKMSDGRVVAETVVETAVGTVATYGAKVVVGAAISAVAGTVGAPAILVAGASTLIVTGINAGVEAITGKTATEWVSDAIIDVGEAAVEKIGSGVKKISGAVSKWFSKW